MKKRLFHNPFYMKSYLKTPIVAAGLILAALNQEAATQWQLNAGASFTSAPSQGSTTGSWNPSVGANYVRIDGDPCSYASASSVNGSPAVSEQISFYNSRAYGRWDWTGTPGLSTVVTIALDVDMNGVGVVKSDASGTRSGSATYEAESWAWTVLYASGYDMNDGGLGQSNARVKRDSGILKTVLLDDWNESTAMETTWGTTEVWTAQPTSDELQARAHGEFDIDVGYQYQSFGGESTLTFDIRAETYSRARATSQSGASANANTESHIYNGGGFGEMQVTLTF
jgi:hypothetical protein